MDRVRPCLSLCLSNIISLRGCLSTYSSALCMRPKELRRRSLTPFISVVSSLSSKSGDMPKRRGTVSRNICKVQKRQFSLKKTLLNRYIWLGCIGYTHMFDGVRHSVGAGAAQGEVQNHNLIGSNESSDRHDKDQVPEKDVREDLC